MTPSTTMTSTNRALSLCLLLPLTLSAGCLVATAGAAVGAGYVVSQQVNNNVHTSQVKIDVDRVWPSVKETLSLYQDLDTAMSVQDFPRSIHTTVRGAAVTVEVEAHDIDLTTVRVSAEKYLAKDEATAEYVMSGILERLSQVQPAR